MPFHDRQNRVNMNRGKLSDSYNLTHILKECHRDLSLNKIQFVWRLQALHLAKMLTRNANFMNDN